MVYYLPAYGVLKIPPSYKFDGIGVESFFARVIDIVSLTDKGMILYDIGGLTNPNIKPWFLISVSGSVGFNHRWTRRILTDGDVFHNKMSCKHRINRKYRTRANTMNESNRLEMVRKIEEYVEEVAGNCS